MMKMMRIGEESGKANAKVATNAMTKVVADANVQRLAALIPIEISISKAKMTPKPAEIELSRAVQEFDREQAHLSVTGQGHVL